MRSINDLDKIASSFSTTEKMPVLFLGHGSPMNAIEENQFVTGFRNLAQNLPKPQGIRFEKLLNPALKTYVCKVDGRLSAI